VPNVTVDVGGAPPAKADRTFAIEGAMPGSYVRCILAKISRAPLRVRASMDSFES
jgi:hypothetical protein